MYTTKGCDIMNMHYNTELKKKLCELICLHNASTIKTAEEYNVPLKTLEKWITAYNKNNHCFDPKVEIARLKKGYLVKGGGTEKKVFVSFSKKNTK